MIDKSKIANKKFNRSILGYDIAEVDTFLDELIREIDRSEQEAGVLRLRVKMLLDELEHSKKHAGHDEHPPVNAETVPLQKTKTAAEAVLMEETIAENAAPSDEAKPAGPAEEAIVEGETVETEDECTAAEADKGSEAQPAAEDAATVETAAADGVNEEAPTADETAAVEEDAQTVCDACGNDCDAADEFGLDEHTEDDER